MSVQEKLMRQALSLALRAEGKTRPNPAVGALVVRDGRIIAQGYHKRAGRRHAEIIALGRAGKRAKGAALYVTLEPCSHFGRRPPCIERILQSGIKKVVVGMKDPNPLNNGRGIRRLRSQGIKVISGVLEQEIKKHNAVFIKYITKNMPFVTVKVAQSLDGKIATESGDSKWISGESARQYVHKLRSEVDAVLVGVNTIIKDDPLLTGRLSPALKKQPLKIIVDSKLRVPSKARIFSPASPGRVIIATTKKGQTLFGCNEKVEVWKITARNGRVSLRALMQRLARQEISHVLIEGGGEVIASALKEKIADRVLIFIAPKIIGGRHAVTSVEGAGINTINQAINLKDVKVRRFGEDIMIEGDIG